MNAEEKRLSVVLHSFALGAWIACSVVVFQHLYSKEYVSDMVMTTSAVDVIMSRMNPNDVSAHPSKILNWKTDHGFRWRAIAYASRLDLGATSPNQAQMKKCAKTLVTAYRVESLNPVTHYLFDHWQPKENREIDITFCAAQDGVFRPTLVRIADIVRRVEP